jgi:hypothetical protein
LSFSCTAYGDPPGREVAWGWLEKCCVKADAGCSILGGPYEFSRGGWYWVEGIYERGSRGQRKVHRRAEMPCKYDLTGLK